MSKSSSFEKVGEVCTLTRLAAPLALVKVRGKQFKSGLETQNLPEARRKLKDFRADLARVDTSLGKISPLQLADKFEKTLQHLAPATITNKTRILKMVREAWQADAKRQLGKSNQVKWSNSSHDIPVSPATIKPSKPCEPCLLWRKTTECSQSPPPRG